MQVADILTPSDVVVSLQVSSKKDTMIFLAHYASNRNKIPYASVFSTIMKRERLGTTGVGNGVAIPHGKMCELTQPYALLVRLACPIEFEAIDDRPVDIIFMLLAPEEASADYLKALARISRLLRDRRTTEAIRSINDAKELYALVIGKTDN